VVADDRGHGGVGPPIVLFHPVITALKPWLEAQLSRIPQKSQLAEDIYYPARNFSGCSLPRPGA